MKNKQIDKTNVRLTGNIKLVLDSEGGLFLESINSNDWLSSSLFKGFKYNKNLEYNTNLRNFINQTVGISSLYDVVDTTRLKHTNDLYKQHHYLYSSGIYSEESQLINENFRAFAPINIEEKSNLPEYFIVLKTSDKDATDINTILEKGSIVQVFDLKEINERIFSKIEDSYIISDLENINVCGYDIETGIHIIKSESTLKQLTKNDQTIEETNNWLTNVYKRNGMLYTNIINMEFAFTDENVDGKFVKYSGFYISLNEYQKIKNTLSIVKTKDTLRNITTPLVLNKYFNRTFSIVGDSFGRNQQSVIEFELLINPEVSTLIQVLYNDIPDFSMLVSQEMINKNISITRRNIINYINNNYTGEKTIVRAEEHGNNIRLITNNIITEGNSISLFSTSPSINIVSDKDGSGSNFFVTPDSYTILTNTYLNPKVFNYVMYDIDGVKTYSKIVSVSNYLGQYLYRLEDKVIKLSSGSIVWLVEEKIEELKTCSILPIYEFDMNTEFNNYQHIRDYDPSKYLNYLQSEYLNPDYIGNAANYFNTTEDQLTDSQISEYKNIITNEVNDYFSGVEEIKDIFIKSIDPINKSSVMINDPYNRLMENQLTALRSVNRLYPFISKWKSENVDSTNNPNLFNLSLPWKHESNNASHIENNREVYKNTHDWFVLADGTPPYEIPNNQLNSFSKYPIDQETFLDEKNDAYEFLQHNLENEKIECFDKIKYDKSQKTSFVYFKGVKYRIEKNLNDYRFSVVVKTSTRLLDDVFKIEIIQNDVFKTYTIFINFYIPEPILTTLERGDKYYFIDKSLFYYSSKIYTTIEASVDFGVDIISLDLYNNSETKKYLGNTLNHTNWYHTTPNGEVLLYVKRGNAGIFNTNFSDILTLGGNFQVQYSQTLDPDSPWYGMIIEFQNIMEIGDNHFWCKKIIVKSNLQDDVLDDDENGFPNIDENVVIDILSQDVYLEFLANPNVFNENNQIYISHAIAYELCYYDKVVTQKANNARYRELCLSNIKMFFKTNHINSNKDKVRIYIDDMNTSILDIKNRTENNLLVKLDSPYSYQIFRQQLYLKPNFNIIQGFYDIALGKSIIPMKTNNRNVFTKIVSKVDNEYLDILGSKKYLNTFNLNEYYYYVRTSINGTMYVKLPWLSSPEELRTPLVSYTMNTSEKINISVEYSQENELLLSDVLNEYVSKIVDIDKLSIADRIKYMNITTNADQDTLSNYDVKEIILTNFINNIFMKIYKIENIIDSTGQLINFATLYNRIILDSGQTIQGNLKIQFTR